MTRRGPIGGVTFDALYRNMRVHVTADIQATVSTKVTDEPGMGLRVPSLPSSLGRPRESLDCRYSARATRPVAPARGAPPA